MAEVRDATSGAAIAYAWLRALDANEALRAELRAAGVPRQSVADLYPYSITDVIPGIAKHLRTIDLRSLLNPTKRKSMRTQRQTLLRMLNGMPFALEKARRIEMISYNTVSQPLSDALSAQLGDPNSPATMSCLAIFWYTWWFMQHRDELTPEQQGALDEVAFWMGKHILKLEMVLA